MAKNALNRKSPKTCMVSLPRLCERVPFSSINCGSSLPPLLQKGGGQTATAGAGERRPSTSTGQIERSVRRDVAARHHAGRLDLHARPHRRGDRDPIDEVPLGTLGL